jgi:hypothetical protein
MQNVGFTDEVARYDVDAMVTVARDLCGQLAPFDLTFAQAEVRDEAIALRPSPAEPVSKLRETLRSAIASVLGKVSEAPEHAQGFEPHVSVAYSNREIPSEPYTGAVQRLETAPALVRLLAAKLIILERNERVYRWSTFGTVPLGGA